MTIHMPCAKCGMTTPHEITVDHNEEFLAHCKNDCDRFLKFPKGHDMSKESVDAA